MNKSVQSVSGLIDSLPGKLNLKARSLLVSIWGDSIAPHGGTVWLGSLIELVAVLGLNERAVRTSVFRLKSDSLLSSTQKGRKSYYTLTKPGMRRFEEATKRIYNHLPPSWDGEWTLLFSERRMLSDETKRQLSLELGWLGFGDIGAGIYGHPNADMNAVEQLLIDLDVKSHVACMKGTELPQQKDNSARIIVQKGWNLEGIEKSYEDFVTNFSPLLNALKSGNTISDEQAFIIRTLAVHDYRRALLRDPLLPEKLLPTHWEGHQARELFHDLYQGIWQQAEEHIKSTLKGVNGDLPPASEDFFKRFGSLRH